MLAMQDESRREVEARRELLALARRIGCEREAIGVGRDGEVRSSNSSVRS